MIPKPNEVWKHTKTGNMYAVLTVAKPSWCPGEPLVVYAPTCGGPDDVWARPVVAQPRWGEASGWTTPLIDGRSRFERVALAATVEHRICLACMERIHDNRCGNGCKFTLMAPNERPTQAVAVARYALDRFETQQT